MANESVYCVGVSTPKIMWLRLLILLLLSTICLNLVEAQGQVGHYRYGFKHLPVQILYFKGSNNILYHDFSGNVWLSTDAGKRWNEVSDVPGNVAAALIKHSFSEARAYILTTDKIHYKTTDKGETWKKFTMPTAPTKKTSVLSFHADREDLLLFKGTECSSWFECKDVTYYTEDNFNSRKLLLENTERCIWACSSSKFDEAPTKSIFCIQYDASGSGSTRKLNDYRLIESEDYFNNTKIIDFNSGGDVRGVIGLGETQEFIIAAVKYPDLKMYVSRNGRNWTRAIFPLNKGPLPKEKEEAYTVLESPTDHLIVDLLSDESKAGSLFISNSKGTYFVKRLNDTHRSKDGYVDFRHSQGGNELVQNVGGILVANIVYNYKEITEIDDQRTKLQSRISFDDGITWKPIKPPEKNFYGKDFPCKERKEKEEKCSLHLHSVIDNHNRGLIFAANAPGVLMGVGHVGEHLLPYDQCDTFLSYDGGVTWKVVNNGAHMYAIGQYGSILVIVDDEQLTDFVSYSVDRGQTWNNKTFSQGMKIRAKYLITDPEATSKSFILLGSSVPDGSTGNRYFTFKLDFSEYFSRDCNKDNKDDFDGWAPQRSDSLSDYNCFMGAETTYYRRRPDAKCFVSKVPEPLSKFCACTENDYECDENYVLAEDGKNCLPLVPERIPEGECEDGKKTYMGSSGFRKIEESQCDPEKGGSVKLDEPVQRKCDFVPIYGEISHRTSYFTIDSSYFYFSESQILMVKTTDGIVKRSIDEGTTWEDVLPGVGPIAYMFLHDHNGTRAYFFPERADESNEYHMWYTLDRGENFKKTSLKKEHNKLNLKILDFHPKNHDWLLFMASTPCPGSGCHSIAYFSENNGENWQEIETWADKCQFGVDTDFSETEDDAVFCSLYKDKNSKISQDKLGGRTSDANPIQLYKFKLKTNKKDRKFILDHTVNFFIFNEFMAAAKEERGQLLLYTSINGSTFNQTAFPPNLVVDKQAYTILPSNTGSIFLDVYKPTRFGYGSLFKSNSNATAFNRILDNTNRNAYGNVDFEKVHDLDGIIIANQVENVNELSDYVKKKIITKISYDDGSHWKRLKMNNSGECQDDCYLNLHGRTDTYGLGSIFSAPSAIGLLIGVGNEGPYLLPYEQCNTYMSRDAGRTWTKIRHGASLYKFGDQGTIIVVVDNKGFTDQVLYSWNYGKDWNTYKFSSNPVRAVHLTTNSNSTSMKFLLYGSTREYSPVIITIDFSQLEKRKCEKGDFEYWNPMDENSRDHKCLLGQEVQYQRRKADSECHIGEFEVMPSNQEACKCTKHDFECADGYWNNAEGECELMGPDPDRPANCQGKYSARSGYVKMKKTKCQGGMDLEKKVEKDCKSGNSIVSKTSVLSQRIADYFYFNESKTILALTMDNAVWQGTDEGHTWEIPNKLKDVKVYAILQNPYFNDHAYCITRDKIFYTSDSGNNFEEIKVPMDPNNLQLPILDFHPDKQGYLIYTGSKSCDFITSTDCTAEAFYTKDNGKNWKSIEKYVRKCLWGRTKKFKKAPDENLIICESYRDKEGSQLSFYDNPIQLLYVTSFKNKKVRNENIVGTALVEEYMIVAELMPSGQSLRLLISLDTNIFAEAQFPSNVPAVQEAYTALQSTTNSIMLHVTTSTTTRNKYGSILKSNENGTYYSLSLDNANRDDAGYVDFEKMLGIHGIALANIVSNVYEVNMGYDKKLKSKITFNDGAKWSYLNKPDYDADNRAYTCDGDIEDCSLHLHSFTERRNPRDSLSSSSAIGLMISVGNVGRYLTRYEQGDTFLTTDAGVTWKEIIKGAYMYEFGNQGGIIVLVDDENPTKYVLYSLNEGKAWQKYNFIKVDDQPIKIRDIDTMPGGLSSKFILRGFDLSRIDEEVIVHLDFSNIHSKNCIFDSDKPDDSDFVQWSPNISTEDGCLFGHKITYFRKKPDSECFIGENLKDKKQKGENCKCTDDDFECEYNFIRNGTGDCVLYPGRKPLHLSQAEQCANGGTVWTELSGYRKLTSSTCEAGNIPSKYKEHPCPRGHSTLFWIIIVLSPFIIVGILTYCFIRGRHGRFGYSPIGRIRLGSSIEPDSILSSIADIFYQIRMPRFVSRLWSRIPLPGRRNRYHYSPVATDDGHEVLMDDYEPDNETL